MAQSQPPPARPPLPQSQGSFQRDFAAPNGRPTSLGPQSPPIAMNYSASSPQPFSPQQYTQPPAAKRPRLSPEGHSPFPSQSYPSTPITQPPTPGANAQMNGPTTPAPRSGLMPPPQRPTDKTEDRNYEDILSGTGINIEEEARMLVRPDYLGGAVPKPSARQQPGTFDYQSNSFSQAASNGAAPASKPESGGGQDSSQQYQPTTEEIKQREEARADWEAARHSQHPLWDLFLLGGALNERIRNISITEHLIDPQSGVLVNTQKHAPPPTVRVNGLEGASRIIDKGQAILDTGQKGERLSDIMKVISLATKARMTGLVSAASRLALERQLHSKGKVPEEWQDIAVPVKPATDVPEGASSPVGRSSLKRTFSEANSNSEVASPDGGPPRFVAVLDKTSQSERSTEDMRRQKRQKRRATAQAEGTSTGEATPDAALAAALESEKKTTKKERKLAESKFTEQQQHKSANEAARMAVSSMLGSRFGGKKARTYDWMNAGKGGAASPATTPGRPLGSGSTSVVGTPTPDRGRAVSKEKHLGQWDEAKDAKIQARDVLLVLESDGRAPKSYVRGTSVPRG